jgi:hypothetical protein
MSVGHSDDVDADAAVEAVVEQCLAGLEGDDPKAGLLFSTYDTDPAAVASGVLQAFQDIELVGSTSGGEMSSVLGYQEDSVTLALFASDTVDITAGLGTGLSADPPAAARKAVQQARGKTDMEPRLCITMPSVGGYDPPLFLRDLGRELGKGVAVLGGGAAPRSNLEQSISAKQFYGADVFQDSVPVLLFSGPLEYSFGVDTGWRSVGRPGRVTRTSEAGLVVDEIDDEPAVAFYERYLGAGATPTRANPLAVFEEDSDDFYLRVPVAVDQATGAIRIQGGLPLGATVQLTVAVTDEIFEGTKSAISKAIRAYPEGSEPEAALLFSCAIRKLRLGTRTGTELAITRGELGDNIPVCGFYSFGEIAPLASGQTRFHNETIVAVLLGTA